MKPGQDEAVTAAELRKQIAAQFGTKESTVKEQRARVMAKMQVKSAAELVRVASWLALIPEAQP